MRPPVMFIHGAFSQPAHFAGWVQRFTAAGYACHAPALPGHGPNDAALLETLTIWDYRAFLRRQIAEMPMVPILVGHSMGGLLAQLLAAEFSCPALACIASAPPWMLTPTVRALPYLAPMALPVLAGHVLHGTPATFRYLVLHDVPEPEQAQLIATFRPESGKAFRAMSLGQVTLPGNRFAGPTICISGTRDRLIPNRTSAAIARLYNARHEKVTHGHWLLSASLEEAVCDSLLRWLAETLPPA